MAAAGPAAAPAAVDADLHVRSMATPQEAAKQAEQQQQIVEEDEFEEFEAEGEAGMRRALRLGL